MGGGAGGGEEGAQAREGFAEGDEEEEGEHGVGDLGEVVAGQPGKQAVEDLGCFIPRGRGEGGKRRYVRFPEPIPDAGIVEEVVQDGEEGGGGGVTCQGNQTKIIRMIPLYPLAFPITGKT